MKSIAAVLLVICGMAIAASQPPAPTPAEHGQPQKKHSHKRGSEGQGDKRGTQESPLFVKVAPTEISKPITSEKPTDGDKEPSFYRWIDRISALVTALATFAMAGFTLALWRSTDKLWLAGENQLNFIKKQAADSAADNAKQLAAVIESAAAAKQSADLALASAVAYKATERAWVGYGGITTTHFKKGVVSTNPLVTRDGVSFQMQWKNSGSTPALKCEAFGEGEVRSATDSTIPKFEKVAVRIPRQITLIPGVQAPVHGPQVTFFDEDLEGLEKRERRLFVWGRVEYEDIFSAGNVRHAEVCFEIEYGGRHRSNNEPHYIFSAIGDQTSAS